MDRGLWSEMNSSWKTQTRYLRKYQGSYTSDYHHKERRPWYRITCLAINRLIVKLEWCLKDIFYWSVMSWGLWGEMNSSRMTHVKLDICEINHFDVFLIFVRKKIEQNLYLQLWSLKWQMIFVKKANWSTINEEQVWF